MVVVSTSTVTNRASLKGVSHEVKDRNLVLSFSSLVDVGNISSMVLVMVDLHGGSINVRLESIKCIRKIRDGISVCSNRKSNSSSEGCSLDEDVTTISSGVCLFG